MSWVDDEWKEGLSHKALKKVQELETSLDRLRKDHKQKLFQLDTLDGAYKKQVRKLEEAKAGTTNLARENQSLLESCRDLENKQEKLQQELHAKESLIACIEGQLSHSKTSLASEAHKTSQIKGELERAQAECLDVVSKLERMQSDYGRLQENCTHQKHQIDRYAEKNKSLEGELKKLQHEVDRLGGSRSYSTSSRESSSEDEGKSLRKRLMSMEAENDKLKNELKTYRDKVETSSTGQRDLLSFDNSVPAPVVDLLSFDPSPKKQSTDLLLFEPQPSKAAVVDLLGGDQDFFGGPTCGLINHNPLMNSSTNDVELEKLQKMVENLEKEKEELRCSSHKLELQVQTKEKEAANLKTEVQDHRNHLEEYKKEMLQKDERISNLIVESNNESSRTKEANTKLAESERKLKLIAQEMECQRHNFEAVRQSLDQKLKEKEKSHKMEVSEQVQANILMEKQLNETKNKMQQEVNHLTNERNNLQTQLERMQSKSTKAELEVNDLKLKVNVSEQSMRSHEITETQLNKKISEITKEKDMLASRLEQSTFKLTNLEDQLKKVKQELSQNEGTINNLQRKESEKEAAMASMGVKYDGKIKELSNMLENLKIQCADLQNKLSSAEDIMKKRECEVSKVNVKLDSLKMEKEVMTEQMQKKEKEDSSLQESLSSLKQSHQDLLNTVKREKEAAKKLENMVEEKDVKLAELEISSSEMAKNISNLKRQEGELKQECQCMLNALMKEKETVKKFQIQVEEYESKASELKECISSGIERASQLQKQEESLKQQYEETLRMYNMEKEEIKGCKLTLEEKDNKITELAASIENELLKVCSLQKQEADHLASIEALKATVVSHVSEISTLESKNKKLCELADAKSTEVRDLTDRLQVISSEAEHFRARLETAQVELQDVSKNKSAMDDTCENLKCLLIGKDEKLEKLDADLTTRKKLCQELEQKMHEVISLGKEKEAELLEAKSRSDESLRKLSEEVEVHIKSALESQQKLEEAVSNVEHISGLLVERDQQIGNLDDEIKNLKTEALAACQREAKVRELLAETSKEHDSLKLQNEEVGVKIMAAKKEIEAKEEELLLKDIEVQQLQDVMLNNKKEFEELTAKLEEVHQHNTMVVEEKETKIQLLSTECSEVSCELKNMGEALQKLEIITKDTIQENENLKDKVAGLEVVVNAKMMVIKKQSAEMLELQEQIENVSSTYEKTVADFKTTNEYLTNESEQIKEIIHNKEDEITKLKSSFEQTSNYLEDTKAELSTKVTEFEGLKKNMEMIKEQLVQSKDTISSKEKEKELLQANIQDYEKRIDEISVKMNAEISQLEQEMCVLESKLVKSTDLVQDKEDELQRLQMEKEVLCNESQALQGSLDILQMDMEDITDTVEALQEKNQQITEAFDAKNDVIKKNESEFASIKKSLEEKIINLSDQYDNATKHVSSLKEMLEKSSNIVNAKEEEIFGLNQQNSTLKEEKEKMQGHLDLIQMDLEDKESNSKALLEKVEELESALQTHKTLLLKKEEAIGIVKIDMDIMSRKKDEEVLGFEGKLSEKECYIEELTSGLREQEHELMILRQKEADLNSILAKKECEVHSLELEVKKHNEEKDEIMDSLSGKKQNIADLKNEIFSMKENQSQTIETFKEEMLQKEIYIYEKEEKIQLLESELKGLNSLSTELEEKLESERQILQQDVELSEITIQKQKNSMEALEHQVEELRNKVEVEKLHFSTTIAEKNSCYEKMESFLKGEIEQLQRRLADLLEENQQAIDVEMQNVKALQTNLEENIECLNREKDRANTLESSTQQTMAEMESRMAECNSIIKENQNNILSLEKEVTELNDKLIIAYQTIENHKQEKNDQVESMMKADKEVKQIRSEMELNISMLSSELQQTSTKLREIEENLEEVIKEKLKIKNDLSQALSKNIRDSEIATSEKESLQTQLESVEKECDELKVQQESMKNDKDSLLKAKKDLCLHLKTADSSLEDLLLAKNETELKCQGLLEDKEKLSLEIRALKAVISDLQSELAIKERHHCDSIFSIESEVKALNLEKLLLQESISVLKTEHLDAVNKIQGTFKHMKEHSTMLEMHLKEEIEDKESKINSYTDKINNLTKTIEIKEAEMILSAEQLNENSTDLEQVIKDQKDKIEQLKENVEELTSNLALEKMSASESITEVRLHSEKIVTSLKTEIRQLEQQLVALREEHQHVLDAELLKIEAIELKLQETAQCMNREKDRANEIEINSQQTTAGLESNISECNLVIKDSETKIASLETEVAELSDKLHMALQRTEDLQKEKHVEVASLRKADQEMKQKQAELEQHISKLNADSEVLAKKLKVKEEKLEEAIMEKDKIENNLKALMNETSIALETALTDKELIQSKFEEIEKERDNLKENLERVLEDHEAVIMAKEELDYQAKTAIEEVEVLNGIKKELEAKNQIILEDGENMKSKIVSLEERIKEFEEELQNTEQKQIDLLQENAGRFEEDIRLLREVNSSSQSKIEEMEKDRLTHEQVEKKLKLVEEHVANLEGIQVSLESELESLKSQKTVLEEENRQLENSVEEIQKDSENQVQSINEALQMANSKVQQTSDALEGQKVLVDLKQQEKQELEKELNDIQKEFDDFKESHKVQIETYEQKLGSEEANAEKELKKVEKKLNIVEDHVANLEGIQVSLESELESLKSQKTVLEEENRQLENLVEEMQTDSKNQVQSVNEALQMANSKVEQTSDAVEAQKVLVGLKQQEKQELKKELNDIHKEFDDFKESHKVQIETYERKLESEEANAEKELKKLKLEIGTLEEKLNASVQKNSDLLSAEETLKFKHLELTTNLKEVNENVKHLETTNSSQADELGALKSECEQLKLAAEKANQDLSKKLKQAETDGHDIVKLEAQSVKLRAELVEEKTETERLCNQLHLMEDKNSEKLKNYEQIVQKQEKQLDELKKDKASLQGKLQLSVNNARRLGDDINKLQKHIQELDKSNGKCTKSPPKERKTMKVNDQVLPKLTRSRNLKIDEAKQKVAIKSQCVQKQEEETSDHVNLNKRKKASSDEDSSCKRSAVDSSEDEPMPILKPVRRTRQLPPKRGRGAQLSTENKSTSVTSKSLIVKDEQVADTKPFTRSRASMIRQGPDALSTITNSPKKDSSTLASRKRLGAAQRSLTFQKGSEIIASSEEPNTEYDEENCKIQ
ncbi:centromere protein F-like [Anneissia japonica]|uniref:centromere protein F-like n=1 Tax=Anneissia japonica TaxID=1529436 RepID=UPI0014256B9B|nr:centromere protein F-like [Anneissia japonica]XP_033103316.1 centromere protein F-like [Anneissia japonica]